MATKLSETGTPPGFFFSWATRDQRFPGFLSRVGENLGTRLLSLEFKMLKIDKHVIQFRSMQQEIIMDGLEKQTFLFSHYILNTATLFDKGKTK